MADAPQAKDKVEDPAKKPGADKAVDPPKESGDASAKLAQEAAASAKPADGGEKKADGTASKADEKPAGSDKPEAEKKANGEKKPDEKVEGDKKAEKPEDKDERSGIERMCDEAYDSLKKACIDKYKSARESARGVLGVAVPALALEGKPIQFKNGSDNLSLASAGTLNFNPDTPLFRPDATNAVVNEAADTKGGAKPEAAVASEASADEKVENGGGILSTIGNAYDSALNFVGLGSSNQSTDAAKPAEVKAATEPVKAGADQAKPGDADDQEGGLLSGIANFGRWGAKMAYSGAKYVYDGISSTVTTIYNAMDTKLLEAAKGTASVADVTSKLKADSGVEITSYKDDAAAWTKIKSEMGESTLDKTKFQVKTDDGMEVLRSEKTTVATLAELGELRATETKDGYEQAWTRPNGDKVIRNADGSWVLFNEAERIVTKVKDGSDLDKTYGEVFRMSVDMSKTAEEAIKGQTESCLKGPSECRLNPGDSRQSVQTFIDGKSVDSGGTIATAKDDGKIVLSNGVDQTQLKLEGDRVRISDLQGGKERLSISAQDFIKRYGGRFGGFKLVEENGVIRAEALDGTAKIGLNDAGTGVDAQLTAVDGPEKGKKLEVLADKAGNDVATYKAADGSEIQRTEISETGFKETTRGVPGWQEFDWTNPENPTYTSYDEFGNQQVQMSEDKTYWGDGLFDWDSDTISFSDGLGGYTIAYDGSDEAYERSTSSASTASSYGSSIATQVSAAASSGNITSGAYQSLAINAIGSVDSAIDACVSSGNFDGLGSLIATKSRLVEALNKYNDCQNRFEEASKKGLSAGQAMEVADNRNLDVYKSIELVQQQDNIGRKRPNWDSV